MIRKTGQDISPDQIIATTPEQKGIHLEVLPEGRYFRNPYTWSHRIFKTTDIPAGKLGVQVRLFGEELPHGEIICGPNQKGFLPDVLAPGKYRINPFAYDVLILNAIQIRPGHVGIVTSLTGHDVLTSDIAPEERNSFLVRAEQKGVLQDVLDPGTYYLNPFKFAVVEVNLQSQRFEISGDEAITFLSEDGFAIRIEGTLEFNIQRDKAALLTHQAGDMDDIVKKIIMPRTRGFSRIEGSKKPAVDFIVGETRQEFQNSLEAHLRKTCDSLGVSVNSVLIRNIIPPDAISKVIRDRELAVQEARKFEQQILQAESQAELGKQEMLAVQNRRKVEAETTKLRAEITARQDQSVKLINAKRELDVATIEREAALAEVAAKLLGAEAERDVIRQTNEAAAGVLAGKAQAFGGGHALARYMLYEKLAPQLQSILTTDNQKNFGLPLPDNSTGKEVE